MRAIWLAAAITIALVRTSTAQDPLDEQDTAGSELLRQEIERRFAERVQANLGLTDEQADKLRATNQRYGPRRRQLIREWLGYELALRREMRPGVAANPDSVSKYMDGQQRVRAEQLKLDQEVDRELRSYLTPVQHAQYRRMWINFLQRINEMRQERQNRFGGQRPFRPRAQPGAPRRRP